MEIERVTAENIPARNGRGKYTQLWAAVEALGDSGDAIAIKGLSVRDKQGVRNAAQARTRRDPRRRTTTYTINGVLYIKCSVATVRELTAVR